LVVGLDPSQHCCCRAGRQGRSGSSCLWQQATKVSGCVEKAKAIEEGIKGISHWCTPEAAAGLQTANMMSFGAAARAAVLGLLCVVVRAS
jgi:hypothetical protein